MHDDKHPLCILYLFMVILCAIAGDYSNNNKTYQNINYNF